jgi:hypothetical protein
VHPLVSRQLAAQRITDMLREAEDSRQAHQARRARRSRRSAHATQLAEIVTKALALPGNDRPSKQPPTVTPGLLVLREACAPPLRCGFGDTGSILPTPPSNAKETEQ